MKFLVRALAAAALASAAGCCSLVYGPEEAGAPGAAADRYYVKEAAFKSSQEFAGVVDDEEEAECGLYFLDDADVKEKLRYCLAGSERPLSLEVRAKKTPRNGRTWDWTTCLCYCTFGIFPGNTEPAEIALSCRVKTASGAFGFEDRFSCDKYVSILPFAFLPGLFASHAAFSPDAQDFSDEAAIADYLPARVARAVRARLDD